MYCIHTDLLFHYSDVAWTSDVSNNWQLDQLLSGLFNFKENSKAPHYWPFEWLGDQCITLKNGQQCRKHFNVITTSCTPVDSTNKVLVMWKRFPWNYLFMIALHIPYSILNTMCNSKIISIPGQYQYIILPIMIVPAAWCRIYAAIILGVRPANDGRCYTVTPSLIGWENSQNDPCICISKRSHNWFG